MLLPILVLQPILVILADARLQHELDAICAFLPGRKLDVSGPSTRVPGMIAGGERCDDGNIGDGDGCSSMCAVEEGFSCSNATCGSPSHADPHNLSLTSCPVSMSTCAVARVGGRIRARVRTCGRGICFRGWQATPVRPRTLVETCRRLRPALVPRMLLGST